MDDFETMPVFGVDAILRDVHAQALGREEGEVADYIPELAKADPAPFGIAVATSRGRLHEIGDTRIPFTIQSVSKALTYCMALELVGRAEVLRRVGVEPSGDPFNAIEFDPLTRRPYNPMVNAGAIAASSLVPGGDVEAKWRFIEEGITRFAGRPLERDDEVYHSASLTNTRNKAIGQLLATFGRLGCDPVDAVELYTRQCSLKVTARDLAAMGATLAGGGVQPLTGAAVVSAESARNALAVMTTAGLYETSGDWLFDVGLPGKSGISGGIVTVAPGKGALGSFAPRLDAAGNSVKGQHAARFLAARLGLDLFASLPGRGA